MTSLDSTANSSQVRLFSPAFGKIGKMKLELVDVLQSVFDQAFRLKPYASELDASSNAIFISAVHVRRAKTRSQISHSKR
jgi:hypothetical protein